MKSNNIYLLNNKITKLNEDVKKYIRETIETFGPINLVIEQEELFLTISLANYKIIEIYIENGEYLAKGINQHNGILESSLQLTDEHFQSVLSFMAKIMWPEKFTDNNLPYTLKYGTVCSCCGSKNVGNAVYYNPNTQEVSNFFDSGYQYHCYGCGYDDILLIDIDQLNYNIDKAYYDYAILYKEFPKYFKGSVIYPNDADSLGEMIIKLSLDEEPNDKPKVLHYCDGISGLKELTLFNKDRFMITDIKEFTNKL